MAHNNDTDEKKNKQKDASADGVKKSEAALREEEVLAFWEAHDIFNKTLEKDAPNGEYVFYDGPPFATGLPHIGSLLSSIVKDVVGRYWTMRGYHVARQWGWDCHGLPIENLIEKELDLKTKKDILDLGIDKFNEACRAAVLRYADEWKEYVTRVGRWTEYDGAYRTMDNSYMESVWWFISEMYKKELLYEGRKVLLYCPHCETPLSKAEIAMDNSYKDITEESVYVKFKVHDPEAHDLPKDTYLLAWTTTSWTLPGNVALAVGDEIEYAVVSSGAETYILAHDRVEAVFAEKAEEVSIVTTKKGAELTGLAYEPLYAIDAVHEQDKEHTFTVLPADFVNTEEGTGVVHTAVIYGEDDYRLGQEHDLPMVPLLDQTGHFLDIAPELIRGVYFKKSEKFIKEDLQERSLLFDTQNHTHSYPHCYRCDTALFYNALTSWFIDVQSIKPKMLETNEDINWYPEHLKHGRYQHILENAPDWTISRNRFWATALPIWKHPETGAVSVFGSLSELKAHTKTSGNTYFLMRHGEASSNIEHTIRTDVTADDPLTDKGRTQVAESVSGLKERNIDLIVVSPFARTKETAEMVRTALGLSEEQVICDERIKEIQIGPAFEGKSWDTFHELFDSFADQFTEAPEGVPENRRDVQRRTGALLYELEETYQGKNILVIGHVSSTYALACAAAGADIEHALSIRESFWLKNAEVRELAFTPLPHNREYELDLHRPYIDEITVVDEHGAQLERVPEVIDCWAESGSMPFASQHYPHAEEDTFTKNFPADFIAEYIAQTRTWFYYMHTVSVLLFGKPSFKNVLTTGNVLAADGTKMSKSKQNYTNPLANLDRYGADAMRYYLMSSVVMQAEDMSFKDEELKEVHNRLINILWNSFKFYDLYQADRAEGYDPIESENALDRWILSRLNELIDTVTKHMDGYDTIRATRPIRDFVDDYSTWYVRRSRDRMKIESNDKQYALATMHHTLGTFAAVIAPVMPYIAESLHRGVSAEGESVHLRAWPEAGAVDEALLRSMELVRNVVSRGLEARAEAGIKGRQPLSTLKVHAEYKSVTEDPALAALIKDEINVKEVVVDEAIEGDVALDTTITPELKIEGDARELIRHIQSLRKKEGRTPGEEIVLLIDTNESGTHILEAYTEEIKHATNTSSIEYAKNKGAEITIGAASFSIAISDQ